MSTDYELLPNLAVLTQFSTLTVGPCDMDRSHSDTDATNSLAADNRLAKAVLDYFV